MTARSRLGWLRRLAISLASCAALLFAVELVVRARVPEVRINDKMLVDAELGFRNPQNRARCWDARGAFDFATNSLGCRGPELPPEGSTSAGERILVVGDSFVHAWRVREEDWIGTSIHDALAKSGRRAEVYSLCAQDWGTAQELLALREYGARARPDTVVLCLYPANDLINNTPELAGRTTISPGDYFRPYLVPDGTGGFERRYALPWRARLRCSDVFRLLEQRWLAGKDSALLRAELAGERVPDVHERIDSGAAPEEHFEIFRPPSPGGRWETAWRTTEALLLAMRDEARSLGARFVVVVIPHLQQVEHTAYAETYDAWLRAAGRERLQEVLDLNLPEQRLEEFFHREGLEHVQMLGLLRESVAETRASVFVPDGHLGGAAHSLMGRAVAERLASGAKDACFDGTGSPVDVPAFLAELPLTLDLSQRELWALFGWGWDHWIPPGASSRFSGWALDTQGYFLARPGSVTLRGILTERASFPAKLSVAYVTTPEKSFAQCEVAAKGAFTLAFDLADPGGRPWIPLRLRIEGARAQEGDPPRLVLQELRIEPTAPKSVPVQESKETKEKKETKVGAHRRSRPHSLRVALRVSTQLVYLLLGLPPRSI